MSLSRRQFLFSAAAVTAAWPTTALSQRGDVTPRLFAHGVASGDPLADRVILWTRVSPPPSRSATGPIDVGWTIASDERFANVIARGTAIAAPDRDFTVKVDAADLQPGRTYFYAFQAGGERSPIGRTRTLPQAAVERVRLAVVSCANYPAGYFNVYRCLVNRDLDAVLHVGDYIYESANGRYEDGTAAGRVPLRPGEAATLEDYRSRYAAYRTDLDLQEAHRLHPFIVVWDDHESADDAWAGGSKNHAGSQGEWSVRFAAAKRAYMEWQPVRESPDGFRLYRRFPFGTLADLVMLDTRSMRDRQVPMTDPALGDPARTMLGRAQEAWLVDQLRASQRDGRRWRLVGQQIPFAPLAPPGLRFAASEDLWDGYPAARGRIFDLLAAERIRDVAILSGDRHSSWACDVARDPWQGYSPRTGDGAAAVELITPAVSSPPMFVDLAARNELTALRSMWPHVKLLEGDHNGYVLVDVTAKRLLGEWYFVPDTTERSSAESRAAAFVCEHGSSRLVSA